MNVMRKKIILFVLCFFLVTGCDIKYDLTIDNDSYDELVSMSFLKSENTYNDISIYSKSKTPITNDSKSDDYYETKIEDNGNYYDLIYHYQHNVDTFRHSYFLSNCYPNFNIQSDDKRIILSSGNRFMCFQGDDGLKADSVQINITTKLKVLNNNADEVNANTYTWRINNSNYENKPIEIILEKAFQIEDVKFQNEASNLFFIIAIVIILVALIIVVFVKRKAKRNNNI